MPATLGSGTASAGALGPVLGEAMVHFALYWLVLARVSGALLLAPVFGSGYIPVTIKAAMVLVISLALLPVVSPPAGGLPTTFLGYAGLLVHELLLGLAIGYLAFLVVAAAETAGTMLDMQLGLSIATAVDPLMNTPVPIIGNLFALLAALAFLLVGGDRIMIGALAGSFRELPLGAGLLSSAGPHAAIDGVAWMFATALEIAAPLVGLGFLGTVAFALLARAAPQLNVLAVALPIQVLAGLGALVVSVPLAFHLLEAIAPRGIEMATHLAGG